MLFLECFASRMGFSYPLLFPLFILFPLFSFLPNKRKLFVREPKDKLLVGSGAAYFDAPTKF